MKLLMRRCPARPPIDASHFPPQARCVLRRGHGGCHLAQASDGHPRMFALLGDWMDEAELSDAGMT
jgi:hypothetical protein